MEKIIIFGASKRGKYVFDKLKEKCNVVAFVDNDPKKLGNKIEGIQVISPSELHEFSGKVIIASQYDKEIKLQLNKMNISNYEVYPSSIEIVFNNLKRKGIELESINALQTFGGSGNGMERFYKDKVKQLDVWEIEESFKEELKKNLPKANIKITDSFKEIRKSSKKYNMILMDNPMGIFNGHCEHFDMFIESFQSMQDQCIVILDVIPNLKNIDKRFNYICNSDHLLARKLFYRVSEPLNISIKEMLQTYREISNAHGYEIEWYFTEERSGDFIQYLVLKLNKI